MEPCNTNILENNSWLERRLYRKTDIQMKYQKPAGLLLAFILFCAGLSAQDHARINEPDMNKPRLFDHLPAEIPVAVSELKGLLFVTPQQGKEVSLKMADQKLAHFSGRVVSSASKYDNKVRSVVIKSAEFNGATLTLSSAVQPDGTVTFQGRIISFQHADLYELEFKNNQYYLVKKNFYDLVNE